MGDSSDPKTLDEATTRTATYAESREALLGSTIGGRYAIRGVLGSGGMGTVYDAVDVSLNRAVAIKVLQQRGDAQSAERFQQEARAAGASGHPNICEVFDLGTLDDGSTFLVMDALVGETLGERIAREEKLPLADILDIMTQVLSGLAAVHELGIVHRDIKPHNIFLARRQGCSALVRILDFGVSKVLGARLSFEGDPPSMPRELPDPMVQSNLTVPGTVLGTPAYMSPEQARGDEDLDARADVYACGLILYEASTGYRARRRVPIAKLLPGAPPGFHAIVDKAIATDREVRHQSAAEFLAELGTLSETVLRASLRPVPPSRGQSVEKSFRGIAGAFGSFSTKFDDAIDDGTIDDEEAEHLQGDLTALKERVEAMQALISKKDAQRKKDEQK